MAKKRCSATVGRVEDNHLGDVVIFGRRQLRIEMIGFYVFHAMTRAVGTWGGSGGREDERIFGTYSTDSSETN